jgi:preprotein translocase subunit SecB
MADSNPDGRGAASGAPQNMSILTQYVKDLSFENPGAPASLLSRDGSPSINIGINVRYQQAPGGGPSDLEVELAMEARAVDGETTLFAVELVYAGVFRLSNIPPEAIQPLAMIECPRLLFPFARQVIADATRNGGFPPLYVDPFDFVSFYRQRLAATQGRPAGTA